MERWRECFQDVMITLHASRKETEERLSFAEPEERDYIEGRLAAYKEVIATLRAAAAEFGVAPD